MGLPVDEATLCLRPPNSGLITEPFVSDELKPLLSAFLTRIVSFDRALFFGLVDILANVTCFEIDSDYPLLAEI